jgi:two-component system, OmpR family, sensor kinase
LNERHILGALSGQEQVFERVMPGPERVHRRSLAAQVPDRVDDQVVASSPTSPK